MLVWPQFVDQYTATGAKPTLPVFFFGHIYETSSKWKETNAACSGCNQMRCASNTKFVYV